MSEPELSQPLSPLRRDRRVAVYLFLAALCVYLATGRYFIDNTDAENMYLALEANLRGDIWLKPGLSGNWWRTWGWTGRPFDPHGLGQSILATPLWFVGNFAAGHIHFASPDLVRRAAVLLFCPIVTALTVAFLFWFLRRLDYDPRLAMAAALTYGFCTLAFPFAKYFFSEPAAGLLLLVTLYYLSPASGPPTLASASAAGALAGMAGLVRPALWPLCLLAGVLVFVRRTNFREALPAAAMFLVFFVPSAYLYGWYNWARFGSPTINCPVDPNRLSLTEIPIGLHGFLLSPGKSIFLYVPAIIVALVGLRALWRRRSLIGWAVAVGAGYHLLIYSAWTDWPGGWTWGPRFLISALPLLWLAMPDGLAAMWRRRMTRVVAEALLALSFAVSLLGVLAFYMAHLDRIEARGQHIGSSYWHWADSPILGAVKTLAHPSLSPISRSVLGHTKEGVGSSKGLKIELRNTPDLWPVFMRRFGFGRWVWGGFVLLLILAAVFLRAAVASTENGRLPSAIPPAG